MSFKANLKRELEKRAWPDKDVNRIDHTVGISAAIVLIGLYLIHSQYSMLYRDIDYMTTSILLAIGIAVLMFYRRQLHFYSKMLLLMVWTFFSFSTLNTLQHVFTSVDKEMNVSVVGKLASFTNKLCSHGGGVYVVNKQFIEGEALICQIPKSQWQVIRKGDNYLLEGSQSEYGFHYSFVRKIYEVKW